MTETVSEATTGSSPAARILGPPMPEKDISGRRWSISRMSAAPRRSPEDSPEEINTSMMDSGVRGKRVHCPPGRNRPQQHRQQNEEEILPPLAPARSPEESEKGGGQERVERHCDEMVA